MSRYGGLLVDHGFRHLWVADAISQFGTRISIVVLPLLAVTGLEASPFQVSALRALETGSFLVLGLPVGAWCDRMRNRPVLVVADVGRALALGSIPLMAFWGALAMWYLYAMVAVVGVLTVFFDVAHQSYVPRLVERRNLVEGNAKLQANMSVAEVAGPSAGGFLVAWLTAPFSVLVNAASFLWSALWLRSIRRSEPKPTRNSKNGLRADIQQGLRFVFTHPILRAVACNGASVVLFQSASLAITIVFLVRDVELSPAMVGFMSSIGPVGGVLAALTTNQLAVHMGQSRMMLLSCVGVGAGMLVVPLTAAGWNLVWFAIGGFISGFFIVALNIVQVSFRQMLCPTTLLGRMNATMRFMLRATAPFGALLGGWIGTQLGMRPTLLIAAIGVLVSALWLFVSPLRRLRDLPADH